MHGYFLLFEPFHSTSQIMSQVDVVEKSSLGPKSESQDLATPPVHVTTEKSQTYQNADEALQMLEDGVLGHITPEQSHRVLRRIDIFVMPLICMYVSPLPPSPPAPHFPYPISQKQKFLQSINPKTN